MALADDLKAQVSKIFREAWADRAGMVVPDPADLKLSNDAVTLERATILYADLSGSTNLVNESSWQFAAEIYKAYLYCAAKLVRDAGGVITSYDGDRIMGVFIGDRQSTNAVRCGLKINYAVQQIINPALANQYNTAYSVKQVVGIDTTIIRAARTGVRGDNDIVWVGRAANYAAKLTDLKLAERTWVTKAVYDMMHQEVKVTNGNNMWKQYSWTQQNNEPIYGSTWWWVI
ncbi:MULTISPECIES: adenylate/guanylate cyclase domain-containing protein [Rhizobium/Agrobacterium group]|uniref:adenylate/guanylate cyclase domain-containing protein n=1 Tax=Rhizobium/Agrobacterium group TaxID=227290 RepID=UPI0023014D05|nr:MULTISPECIES: adenylate/guanylate cyclase domain-containing protein [Rhizobium/Agrobacterium group]MDA5635758.1 adenylate/guanylate cyclase domain-containing protein [Agrobacterium sp. ST15.16.024]MDF1891523.1 adenylate/guanylate cyclase domain-containing protein [Rhizobium rhizogenes]